MATLLWLACGACSGESMTILGVDGVGKTGDTLLDFLEQYHVQLLWHPSLSLESSQEQENVYHLCKGRNIWHDKHIPLTSTFVPRRRRAPSGA